MLVTVAVTVGTGNLAFGVFAGVVLAALLFARRVARLAEVRAVIDPDGGEIVYRVGGELFFASSSGLGDEFDYDGDPDRIVIDLTDSHIWDASTVAALDQVLAKYAHRGKQVELVGPNRASRHIHRTLSGHLTASH